MKKVNFNNLIVLIFFIKGDDNETKKFLSIVNKRIVATALKKRLCQHKSITTKSKNG